MHLRQPTPYPPLPPMPPTMGTRMGPPLPRLMWFVSLSPNTICLCLLLHLILLICQLQLSALLNAPAHKLSHNSGWFQSSPTSQPVWPMTDPYSGSDFSYSAIAPVRSNSASVSWCGPACNPALLSQLGALGNQHSGSLKGLPELPRASFSPHLKRRITFQPAVAAAAHAPTGACAPSLFSPRTLADAMSQPDAAKWQQASDVELPTMNAPQVWKVCYNEAVC